MASTTVLVPVASTRTTSAAFSRWMTHGSILLADVVGIAGAGVVAVITRYLFHAQFAISDYFDFAPCVLIFLLVFSFSGLYPGIGTSPIEEFGLILRSSTISFLLLISMTFFLREGILSSRIVFVLAWLLTIVLVPLSRRFMRGWCACQPWWGIPTVIIGEKDAGLMMLGLLRGHCRVGLRPVAMLIDESTYDSNHSFESSPVFFGSLSDAKVVAKQYRDCYAVLAMPNTGAERIKEIFNEYAEHYRNVLIIPDLFGMRSLSVSTKDICGVLALKLDQKLTLLFPRLMKRSFDLLISLTVGILLSPVLLALCFAVMVSSTGPIFYAQKRIGRGNEVFNVWKFRSMVVDADAVLASHLERDPALREEWERDHKLKKDPRVTWIGRILRKTSLDELPQLWNVICGTMSLVGPRPIVQSEVQKYGRIYGQYQRVTPGVTGLWQISGRNNTTYELRTRIDDYYVSNWSLSMDIYILFRTLKTVLLSEGAY
ncbi:undecaprenyl-phosphate galactose phosphotransferase WbaP [Granulicella sp. WH15]|uniref:undecaprenyl-phosphate galactose phosphotransferase WbaP n=1 Tax=Granulicella sp. WH15 TaxID=2602070 RepID=UPI001366D164|nr:undecaprenyl-phosphate galactose phosphotransferase WbaP [Granulicella sp. WH15]QHN02180.1 undecaprenyl-phosphate galactose phosphotransferase WbaP [Granulicella sp. WH15]